MFAEDDLVLDLFACRLMPPVDRNKPARLRSRIHVSSPWPSIRWRFLCIFKITLIHEKPRWFAGVIHIDRMITSKSTPFTEFSENPEVLLSSASMVFLIQRMLSTAQACTLTKSAEVWRKWQLVTDHIYGGNRRGWSSDFIGCFPRHYEEILPIINQS